MKTHLPRRTFLRRTATAPASVALPTLIPATALGLDRVAPNRRLALRPMRAPWQLG